MAAINEGRPILDTALACIHEGQPIYRGLSALALAKTASVEDVARLLWQCDPHDPFAAPAPALGPSWRATAQALRRRPVPERAIALLALAQAELHGPSWLIEPGALALAAGQHLRAAFACFLARPAESRPLHEQCRRDWRLPQTAADALHAALVLAADHEMNMVAFVGRCLSSVGAPMGAATLAAMCNVQASLNGGDIPRVEALWDELLADRDLQSAVARHLASGKGLAGCAYSSGKRRFQPNRHQPQPGGKEARRFGVAVGRIEPPTPSRSSRPGGAVSNSGLRQVSAKPGHGQQRAPVTVGFVVIQSGQTRSAQPRDRNAIHLDLSVPNCE